MAVTVHPATGERFDDLARLFGPSGAYGHCWCTYWRLTGRQFEAATPSQRRDLLRALTQAETPPGLLAYDEEGEPVGWVALAPRTAYGRIQRSPKLKPVDDLDVQAVTCFFVPRPHRGQGIAAALLDGAVQEAGQRGATAVEGFPVDTAGRAPDASVFTGTLSLFLSAGFREVARRGSRPLVRLLLDPAGVTAAGR